MSRVSFIVYDSATGEILRSGSCDEAIVPLQASEAGEAAMAYPVPAQGVDATHYVADPAGNPTVTAKAPMGAALDKPNVKADGVDEIVIAPIPLDAVARLAHPDGFYETIAHDGSLEFTTELVGIHMLRLTGVPYVEQILSFEAVP